MTTGLFGVNQRESYGKCLGGLQKFPTHFLYRNFYAPLKFLPQLAIEKRPFKGPFKGKASYVFHASLLSGHCTLLYPYQQKGMTMETMCFFPL